VGKQRTKTTFCPKYLSQSFAIMPLEPRMSNIFSDFFMFMKLAVGSIIKHRLALGPRPGSGHPLDRL
jgi:hypothetical protein